MQEMGEVDFVQPIRRAFPWYNLSVGLTPASSPCRGATGESVLIVLGERSFLQSGTAGLRCFDSRLLAQRPLLERCPAAAASENRARRFVPNWAQADSRAGPACQCLALRERWQRAALTERVASPESFFHKFSKKTCKI